MWGPGPGLTHTENGIQVIKFTNMTKPLPAVLVVRKTPLTFRYTGQPTLCFKCASADHIIRDCPQNKKKNPTVAPAASSSSDESPNETDREEMPADDTGDEQSSDEPQPAKRKRKAHFNQS